MVDKRLSYCYRLYDVVRIDHFRGFDQYFSIPAGAENAVGGHWEQGPGIDLFRRVKEALGEKEIIAEDLGYVTDSVRRLVAETGYPGMKVLEFAFDSGVPGAPAIICPTITRKIAWLIREHMIMRPLPDGLNRLSRRSRNWPGIISATIIRRWRSCT